MSAVTLAAAILIAGAALILNSAQTEATPNKVTASKPCGSCHPPNKPPRVANIRLQKSLRVSPGDEQSSQLPPRAVEQAGIRAADCRAG